MITLGRELLKDYILGSLESKIVKAKQSRRIREYRVFCPQDNPLTLPGNPTE